MGGLGRSYATGRILPPNAIELPNNAQFLLCRSAALIRNAQFGHNFRKHFESGSIQQTHGINFTDSFPPDAAIGTQVVNKDNPFRNFTPKGCTNCENVAAQGWVPSGKCS